jgi:hypothetical protein
MGDGDPLFRAAHLQLNRWNNIPANSGLRQALGSIVYPAYYFDFETCQTVIPLYQDTAPYDQTPTR